MALIKSISGIRGTIGGKPGESLTPLDIARFTGAYGTWLLRRTGSSSPSVVVGRDARTTGSMVSSIVISTLRGLGISVTDLGLATTPTVEIAVTGSGCSGGIIITASHNPANWNALKLLNEKGEFLSEKDGNDVLDIAAREDFVFCSHEKAGVLLTDNSWAEKHIKAVLSMKLTDREAIRKTGFKIAVDCINSVGGLVLPQLLSQLGVKETILLNGTADGNFAHNPEPLQENLADISELVKKERADLGLVVDPDVDRLAIICEDGSMFGEEYTLVTVSDYVLSHTPGATVSNMSSSMALRDVSERHGCKYFSSAVGEVNVVEEMKIRGAVIGGEGNGGIIYPELHYGRDALAGIALFLSHLARTRLSCSGLRRTYPDYYMAKKKIVMEKSQETDRIIKELKRHFSDQKTDERDGLKIETEEGWIHIRKSNTEPVLRIYSEGKSEESADRLASEIMSFVKNL